jgi:hypothetical protein
VQQPSTRRLTTILLALLAVGFTALPARLGVVAAVVMEVLLVVCGAWLAVRAARPWLASASFPLRFVAVLLAALAIGQIARSKRAFPFMPYTMYGRAAEGDANFYEYVAQRRSGARERFRPSLVIATLGRARIVKGLAREFDAFAAPEAEDRDAPLGRATDLLRALIARQNQENRGDPITQVEVVRVTLPPPYQPEGATRRTLTRITADP